MKLDGTAALDGYYKHPTSERFFSGDGQVAGQLDEDGVLYTIEPFGVTEQIEANWRGSGAARILRSELGGEKQGVVLDTSRMPGLTGFFYLVHRP